MPAGVPSRTALSPKCTSPESARCNPESASSSVVLPHPEGPTTDTNSPSPTVKLMLPRTSSGGGPAKLLRSPSTLRSGEGIGGTVDRTMRADRTAPARMYPTGLVLDCRDHVVDVERLGHHPRLEERVVDRLDRLLGDRGGLEPRRRNGFGN